MDKTALTLAAKLLCGEHKSTGWGFQNSRWGLEECSRTKTFTAGVNFRYFAFALIDWNGTAVCCVL
jgi:hypothetical protein